MRILPQTAMQNRIWQRLVYCNDLEQILNLIFDDRLRIQPFLLQRQVNALNFRYVILVIYCDHQDPKNI